MLPDSRTIQWETLSRMVAVIDPGATLADAELAARGHLSVYVLAVETPTGDHEWVLKASPDGGSHGIETEARILRIVEEHTSIPVPGVIGAVDSHDSLPTPYFLMNRIDGEHFEKRSICQFSVAALERMARESGRYLAEMHALDGPSGYGTIDIDDSQQLSGERPVADIDQLTVVDFQGSSPPETIEWPTVLRTWTEDTLERLATSGFGDLTPSIRPVLFDAIDSMTGPFLPAFGRIDHGLHNLLLEDETGRISGVIDWAFSLSVPPAYDVACVEANLSFDPWAMSCTTPERTRTVRAGLLAGYRESGDPRTIDGFRRNRSAYLMVALLRAMNHLDRNPEFVMPNATDEQLDRVGKQYREFVTEFVDR